MNLEACRRQIDRVLGNLLDEDDKTLWDGVLRQGQDDLLSPIRQAQIAVPLRVKTDLELFRIESEIVRDDGDIRPDHVREMLDGLMRDILPEPS